VAVDRTRPSAPDGRSLLTVVEQATAPPLAQRPAMRPDEAAGIAALFKILANDTRIRLLHELTRGGEVRVSDLASSLGMTQQAVSNQLQRLVNQRIVATRRDGNNIYYRIIDSCVPPLLELGWCLHDSTQARAHR
jgi:DNA-binding transcriptional ArsR family regulator